MPDTPAQFLERQSAWRGDDTAIRVVETGERVTYTDLDDRADRFASALSDAGVRPGDRVPLALFNTVAFPVCLYGCFKLGAVPVALNYRGSRGDHRTVFETVNPQALVYDAAVAESVTAAEDAAGIDAIEICVGSGDGDGNDDAASFESVLDRGRPETPTVEPAEMNDIAYMITTSGTTGEPKAVAYTGWSGWARNRTAISASGMSPRTVWLALLPWFHGSGIDTVVRSSIAVGGTVLALRDYSDPTQVLDAVERYDVTHLMSVPTVTERIARVEDVAKRDLSSIECWRHTGEILSERQITLFTERLTPNVFDSYGSSEAGLNTMLRPEDLPGYAGTVGRPTVGTDIRVVELDDDRFVGPEETVPAGKRGEVLVRSDQLFRSYFPPDGTRNERVHEGWYYTHDVGIVTEEGYLRITGRTDDMIISGGELVAAVEVEESLERHPDVRAAAVVGHPDEKWGQRVTAYVAGAEDLSAAELEEFCKQHDDLADYKRPRAYEFVDGIERNETGKKLRAAYREEGH